MSRPVAPTSRSDNILTKYFRLAVKTELFLMYGNSVYWWSAINPGVQQPVMEDPELETVNTNQEDHRYCLSF